MQRDGAAFINGESVLHEGGNSNMRSNGDTPANGRGDVSANVNGQMQGGELHGSVGVSANGSDEMEGGSDTYAFVRLRRRLAEKANDAKERAVSYVAIGDSVTQGCMEDGVMDYDNVYHQVLKRGIEHRYPGTVLNVINSGVNGDTVVASRSRWDRDLFQYKPDLVTICFGHNDVHGREEGLSDFTATLGKLVTRIRRETESEVLLITPCMMMKRDNDRIAAVHKPLIPTFVKLARDGILPLYVEAVRELAAEQNIPIFDCYALWETMEREGNDIHDYLSNGINHPTPAFHAAWGEALCVRLLH